MAEPWGDVRAELCCTLEMVRSGHKHAHVSTHMHTQTRAHPVRGEPLVVLSGREILWNTVERSTIEVEEQQIIKYLRSRRAGRSDRDEEMVGTAPPLLTRELRPGAQPRGPRSAAAGAQ